MNDEQYFLANAYLDGELTDEERRIAEADPEVMTEVEVLRALQAELRDTPTPSGAARESAIGAALAEFGTGHAQPDADTDDVDTDLPSSDGERTAPVPFRPRPAYAKYLGIAAAVVAVAGLGIVVTQANSGDDDAATGDIAPAAEATAEDTAELGTFTEGVDVAEDGVEESADMAVSAGAADADAGGQDDGGEEMAAAIAEDESGREMTAESSAEASDEMAEAEVAADGDAGSDVTSSAQQRWIVGLQFDPEAPIRDDRDLGVYGVYLLEERDAERLPPSPNTQCGVDDEILDTATLLVDDAPTRVFVSLIEAEGLVFARAIDTCAVILVGSIYVS